MQCRPVMDKLDKVIDLLKKGEKPKAICQDMKFCKASVSILDSKPVASSPSALVTTIWQGLPEAPASGCLFCTFFSSLLEDLVANKRDDMIDIIRENKDKICMSRPPEWKVWYCSYGSASLEDEDGYANVCVRSTMVQCHDVMKDFDKLVALLKKGEKPSAVCKTTEFCASSKVIASASPNAGNTSCAYCNGVVTVLELALEQKPDEVKEAREAAGIVCGLLPKDDQVRLCVLCALVDAAMVVLTT